MKESVWEIENQERLPGHGLDKDLEAIRSAIWSLNGRGYDIEGLPEYVREYVQYVLEP